MTIHASIDLGSNTVRLLVARKEKDYLTFLYSDHKITRLGENLKNTGSLTPEAMDRTISAISLLKEKADQFHPENIWVAATSAVRNARNRDFFTTQVHQKTGLDVEIISWEEEGRRMLLGVHDGLRKKIPGGLVFDIGGGSTEFILFEGKEPVQSRGSDLGVVRLSEQYCSGEVIDEEKFLEMEKEIEETVRHIRAQFHIEKQIQLVGVAGTVTTVAALDLDLFPYDPEKVNGHILSSKKIHSLTEKLRQMSLTERRALPPLEKGREDLIIPGMVIVRKIMDHFSCDELMVCEWGLREGIMLDRLCRKKS